MAILINKHLGIHHEIVQNTVIGRSNETDLQMSFPTISKQHLKVFEQDGQWFAEDLGSSNFTYVNGEKISRCLLQPGDYVRLDIYTVVFFLVEPPQLAEISVYDAGSTLRQRLPITKPSLRIGRHLLNNHIPIDDPRVSSYHIELTRKERRWQLSLARPGLKVLVNQHPVEAAVIHPGDKIGIGSTVLEISSTIVREWQEVAKVQTRLQELYDTLRMQARTLEEAIHENFPVLAGTRDWHKTFLDIFAMVDRSLKELQQISDTLHQLIPSMESIEVDTIILNQALLSTRRCNNLTNYLDLVLRDNRLVQIQHADLTQQEELIRKLHDDVRGCLEHDNPTMRL